uniref:Uncharacterized protein n=1 Tax=Moniliophthora roreri TaxID=221103 RepID=A0A0W0GCV8_MONRR
MAPVKPFRFNQKE